MKRFVKDKRGFVSIYMILWMAVLIPLLMFTFVDLSQYAYESTHLKAITDNACASAVTQINEDLVPQGILEIDEQRAKTVALNIIKSDLLLNDDFTPTENSGLKDKPTIQVNVVNVTNPNGYAFTTPAGTVKIYKPSVVIYAEYPVKGLFYHNGVVMQKVGISQVQFRTTQK